MLALKGFSVEVDSSGDKLDKKIRNAQVEGFNYIGVIGPKELEEKKITLRREIQHKFLARFRYILNCEFIPRAIKASKIEKRV